MTDAHAAAAITQPAPTKITRMFAASRARVFAAWTTAEAVKRWFCPKDLTIPDATVEFRVGGRFDVCMRLPNGIEHWTRGVFAEIVPDQRLVIDMSVATDDGMPLFTAHTEIDFTDVHDGTRVDVVQTYSFANQAMAAPMVAGAEIGWSQTLDKLAAEVARPAVDQPIRSVAHGTFRIERTYAVPAQRLFAAFATEAAKSKWFTGNETWTLIERNFAFRPGGRERLSGRWQSGLVTTFDAIYHDIIPAERIVYSYEMLMDDRKISVSLATVEITSVAPDQSKLTITEQGAFLDGYDDAGSRERGTNGLLDNLGASL